MLEHLISHELDPVVCEDSPTDFVGLELTRPDLLLGAQLKTADWLEQAGFADSNEVTKEAAASTARAAFTSLTTAQNLETQREALTQLHCPEEIRHVIGMLTAYDWEFVNQAKELRGYVVAKLMEETTNPKADIRLKALGMLGKVTEVGLFTDKVEVKKADQTDEELDARIKERLNKLRGVMDVIGHTPQVQDADDKSVA